MNQNEPNGPNQHEGPSEPNHADEQHVEQPPSAPAEQTAQNRRQAPVEPAAATDVAAVSKERLLFLVILIAVGGLAARFYYKSNTAAPEAHQENVQLKQDLANAQALLDELKNAKYQQQAQQAVSESRLVKATHDVDNAEKAIKALEAESPPGRRPRPTSGTPTRESALRSIRRRSDNSRHSTSRTVPPRTPRRRSVTDSPGFAEPSLRPGPTSLPPSPPSPTFSPNWLRSPTTRPRLRPPTPNRINSFAPSWPPARHPLLPMHRT